MTLEGRGIIVNIKEIPTGLIITVLTSEHGLKKGFKKKCKQNLTLASFGIVTCVARSFNQLGKLDFEQEKSIYGRVFQDIDKLNTLQLTCDLINYLIPEGQNNSSLFEEFEVFLLSLAKIGNGWRAKLIEFLLILLSELGYAPELEVCTICKKSQDLQYISPRTAKAVCKEHGEEFADKLFKFHESLRRPISGEISQNEFSDSLKIIFYFLNKIIKDANLPESILKNYYNRFLVADSQT